MRRGGAERLRRGENRRRSMRALRREAGGSGGKRRRAGSTAVRRVPWQIRLSVELGEISAICRYTDKRSGLSHVYQYRALIP